MDLVIKEYGESVLSAISMAAVIGLVMLMIQGPVAQMCEAFVKVWCL